MTSQWEAWQQTQTSTGDAWLKHPRDAGRDMKIQVRDWKELTRPAKTSTVYPLGYPTAVTRTQGFYGVEADLTLMTVDQPQRRELAKLLSSGDVLLLQTPGSSGDYPGDQWWVAVAGDITEAAVVQFWERHRFVTVRVVEQASPV